MTFDILIFGKSAVSNFLLVALERVMHQQMALLAQKKYTSVLCRCNAGACVMTCTHHPPPPKDPTKSLSSWEASLYLKGPVAAAAPSAAAAAG